MYLDELGVITGDLAGSQEMISNPLGTSVLPTRPASSQANFTGDEQVASPPVTAEFLNLAGSEGTATIPAVTTHAGLGPLTLPKSWGPEDLRQLGVFPKSKRAEIQYNPVVKNDGSDDLNDDPLDLTDLWQLDLPLST